jgi:hypothetical protein
LREALAARPDDDFVLAAPARRSRAASPASGRSSKAAKQASVAARALAFAWRHPLEIAISIGLAAAASAIIWNALALQTARHPAPLFSPRGQPRLEMPAPLPPTRPGMAVQDPAPPLTFAPGPISQPAPAVIVPPPRPAIRDAVGEVIRNSEASRGGEPSAQPKSAPVPLAAIAKPPAARDAIGDLIRLGEPAPIPPGYVGKPEPTRLVATGQRALAKLNYLSSKSDGIMGPETRQAVERFERDRRLPVTGEFGPRTARELAAQSGIAVE